MHYLEAYFITSCVIGVIMSTILSIKISDPKKMKDFDWKHSMEIINSMEKEGHIQIEKYGDRIVFNEKDAVGESMMETIKFMAYFIDKHPKLYLLLIFLTGVFSYTIGWPIFLYRRIMS